MTRKALATAFLIIIIALAGCGSPPPTVDWRSEALGPWKFPEPYRRLYLRNVGVNEIADVSTRAITLGPERRSVDSQIVRDEVRGALSGLGLFHDVVNVPGGDVTDPAGKPAGGDLEQPQRQPGLILDLELDSVALFHAGENDKARLAFWLWILTGLPGLSVHDQLYQVEFEALAQISDAVTGEVLVPWEPLRSSTPEPLALSFHERSSGLVSYLKTNVMPPYVIDVDDREVLKKILAPTMRPMIASLVQLFDQISFLPVTRIGAVPVPCPGVKLEEVRAGGDGRVTGDTMDVRLVVTLEKGVRALREVRVGGVTRLDMSTAPPAPAGEKRAELQLEDIPIPRDKPANVELFFAGEDGPRRILVIRSAPSDEVRPERKR